MRSPLKVLAAFAAIGFFAFPAYAQFGIPGIPRIPRIPGIPGGGRLGGALNALDRLGVINVPRIGYSPLGNYYAPGSASMYLGRGSYYGYGGWQSQIPYYGSYYRSRYYNDGYYNGYNGYYGNGYYNDPYGTGDSGFRLAMDDPTYWRSTNPARIADGGDPRAGRDFDSRANRWIEPLDNNVQAPLVVMGSGTPYQGPVRPVTRPAYANPFTPYSTRPSSIQRTLWWPFFRYDPEIAYYGVSVDEAQYQVALLDQPAGAVVAPFRPGARSEPKPVSAEDRESAQQFTRQGQQEFRSANYERATRSFRHAVLDDPRNGVVMLMLAQSLMATGSYDEAAGATQQAMLLLPEEQWGVVVANYKDLYGRAGDFNDQLKTLQKTSDEQAENPALHFLLAYQYGYLGYPEFAVKRLAKIAKLAPDDRLSTRLKQVMDAKLKDTSVLPPE